MAKVILIGSYGDSLINFRGKLLEEMVQMGHEVLACAPDISEKVRDKLTKLGVGFQEVQLHRTGINPVHDVQSLMSLRQVISDFSPDHFLAYTIKPVIYGSIAARFSGVPHINSIITGLGNVVVGGKGRYRIINFIVKKLYSFALKSNNCVFFQNPDDLAFFEQEGYLRGKDQAVLINGSGIDIQDFQPAPLPQPLSFLLIARLISDKGIREYAEAARALKSRYPELRFLLVGIFDTNPQALTREEIEGWVADGTIEFLGQLEDVRGAIAESSVYVLPSYYREGTPRTVLEALAMGRPIITTDTPGCRETVEIGKNGFLIPARDVSALVSAMESFVHEPELLSKYGKESRKIAVGKYDVRKVNQKIIQSMGLEK